jgi:AbrB family looped-hinge helix DNA binding protein
LITRIDANGRVLLPLGIRYRLDLNEDDELAVEYLGDGTILLKKIISQARSEGIAASEKEQSQREMLVLNR